MLTSEKIKKYAKQIGADLVGISSMDRCEGAPLQMDVRQIFPNAKSIIVLAFRIPRGYFRGIEEGTYFAPYTAMGYAGINEIYGPIVLRELCCYIEDYGFEAVPIPNISFHNNCNWMERYETGKMTDSSVPVAAGRAAPDVLVDMRALAYAAGLGEYGYSKVFLTPEFGPMQRFVALLTDFEMEPDPIFEGKICDRCKMCARACSGKAISMTETEYITIAGHKCEYAKIDLMACHKAYRGTVPEYNPFLKEGVEVGLGDQSESMGLPPYMRHMHAVEGARGCMRECYIHLENVGRLTRKFENPFRKRKPWIIDRGDDTDMKNKEAQQILY
jgi:epoxyqueuosine reductase